MCCLEFIVKGEFLWIPEHHSSGFSWPTTSVHRAPAAGRLALEQARGSHPRPGWALNEKLLILLKCDGCVWKEFCCIALYVYKPVSCLWTHIVLNFHCVPVLQVDIYIKFLFTVKIVCIKLSFDNSLFLHWSIADIPMSVGIIDPRANPTQLNTVEFLWDPSKRTSVFIQVAWQTTLVFLFY